MVRVACRWTGPGLHQTTRSGLGTAGWLCLFHVVIAVIACPDQQALRAVTRPQRTVSLDGSHKSLHCCCHAYTDLGDGPHSAERTHTATVHSSVSEHLGASAQGPTPPPPAKRPSRLCPAASSLRNDMQTPSPALPHTAGNTVNRPKHTRRASPRCTCWTSLRPCIS